MTQVQLADKTDVTKQAISDIERGRRIPSLPLAHRIAAALNCKVDDIEFVKDTG